MWGNGDKVPVEMKLEQTGDSIHGIYYYTHIGMDLLISGCLMNDTLRLEEHNNAGKLTGVFIGRWYPEGDSIRGNWARKKDGSVFKFSVQRTYWKDYKLIKKTVSHYRNNTHTADNLMIHSEWLEMMNYPDPGTQNIFNSSPGNQEVMAPKKNTESGKGFFGIEIDGYLVYYTQHKEVYPHLYTNQFISFGE